MTAGAQPTAPDDGFSIVIATRDRSAAVVELVRRLRSMPEPAEQVVVVNDGSLDDTTEQLAALDDPPEIITGPGEGPSAARNLGASAASEPWLIFLDDDDLPSARWMSEFRKLARSHPDAAHLSVGFDRRWQGSVTPMPPEPLGPAFGDVTANFLAGTFAVRAEQFRQVGGFCDDLRCMEFTDLTLRLMSRIRRERLEVHTSAARTITIEVRPPEERTSQLPDVLEQSWRLVRERNREAFEADPAFCANQSATVAAAWSRVGSDRRALRWMWDSVRTHPSPRHLAQLGLAMTGPLGRRLRQRR